MSRKRLKTGDRIRLKVPTMCGWKGTGTVVRDMTHDNDTVDFAKDGDDDWPPSVACRHEVALIRSQAKATR